ncbi:MAG: hypothetical protein KGI00_04390 [Candidatus Micrarchaeota archaeon]|nr:hypothetical protein [Candidatus Micrarchaeota archaeon]MDE1824047.1 hypothetical protein [Candidatus Micrarchaeota archaeon]MDE1849938.1 hypothetical protein [Candidatus Micrarchaeota archaeon]
MDQSTIIYLSVTGLMALFIFLGPSYGPLSIPVRILAVLAVILILIINFADFLVFPLFTKLLGISMVPAKGYMIPKTQDSVIKNVSGLFYATGYLTANIYNYVFTAEEMVQGEEQDMAGGPDKWEKAVMSIDFPFKFNVMTVAHDIQKFREDLEGKRSFLEFQYSKEMGSGNPSPSFIDELQRKMRVIEMRMDRLGQGERPVDSVMYMETTAVGVSQKEATDKLTEQLSHLQTVFNVFDLSITRVVGRELYLLHKYNYIVPEIKDLNANFTVQS